MIGFVFGAARRGRLDHRGRPVDAGREPGSARSQRRPCSEKRSAAAAKAAPPADTAARPQPAVSLIEKPLIARLQESDVMRTLGGILATGGRPPTSRGWAGRRCARAFR